MERDSIKVSVIVPVFNVEKYLGQCLESIVNQTLEDIEIICIDDGSSDSSLDILKDYEKRDLRVKVISQKNMGVSNARNRGLEIATAEYILIATLEVETCHRYFTLLSLELMVAQRALCVPSIMSRLLVSLSIVESYEKIFFIIRKADVARIG